MCYQNYYSQKQHVPYCISIQQATAFRINNVTEKSEAKLCTFYSILKVFMTKHLLELWIDCHNYSTLTPNLRIAKLLLFITNATINLLQPHLTVIQLTYWTSLQLDCFD